MAGKSIQKKVSAYAYPSARGKKGRYVLHGTYVVDDMSKICKLNATAKKSWGDRIK